MLAPLCFVENIVVVSTLLGGQLLQVNQDREVIARLDRRNVIAVFPLKDLLRAILDQILKAPYLNREQDLGLAFRSRDVKGDTVEVGDGLVNGRGRGTSSWLAGAVAAPESLDLPREPLGQNRLDQDVLVVEEKHCCGGLRLRRVAASPRLELVDDDGGAGEVRYRRDVRRADDGHVT